MQEPGVPATRSAASFRLAAVVPTWNEEALIERALESLRRGGVDEVVVVDGGSTDGTVGRAAALADHVLEERGGLFRQLNRGGGRAGGAVLLFHYADVLFPPEGRAAIARVLEDPAAVGGAFRLSFASERWCYSLTAAAANWRNRLRFGPFGDQSLFARADAFRRLGGFREDAFFADLDLVRRLRRTGRFRIVPQAVQASVRRWESMGYLRAHFAHWRLYARYFASGGRAAPAGEGRARALRAMR